MAKILRVSEIQAAVVGQVEGPTGVLHDVRPLTFDTHQQLVNAGTGDDLATLRACVEAVVPTMTAAEVGGLTSQSAQAILMLSGAGIEAVEKMFPNAVRSETSSTSPA